MIFAIILFVVTYAALLVFPKYRPYIACGSAIIYVIFGYLPIDKVFFSVDWNVIMMIFGTMGLVSLFIESQMPKNLADRLTSRMPNVKWVFVSLALFAGIVSAFIDNVATVLIVVPIALSVSKRLNVSPVPAVIAIAISSNLQGAATLVGDTTSILLSGQAGMNFFDFFIYGGKPGLFFIVQAAAIVSAVVLLIVFKNLKQKTSRVEPEKVNDYVPTALILIMIALLIGASFVKSAPKTINGIICISLFAVGLLISSAKNKSAVKVVHALKEVDFSTLILLMGLFVIVASVKEAGVINALGDLISSISGGNIFIAYSIFVWFSVLFSAFVDNIPYVATMLPVSAAVSTSLGIDPTLLYFALISGATLGGCLTPIGASANITALGILRKEGYNVGLKEYFKISVPFTLTAVMTGYILIWLFFS